MPGWLKHAFAVDAGPIDPTPEQLEIVDRLAREVVRRGMTVPALAFLEMTQPLNFVAAQALHFFQPLLSAVFDVRKQQQFAEFLEHRGAIDFICRAIERTVADESPNPSSGSSG
jgi:hypothetical protein